MSKTLLDNIQYVVAVTSVTEFSIRDDLEAP